MHPALVAARGALRRDLSAAVGTTLDGRPWPVGVWEAALQDALAQRAWWLAQWEQGADHVLGLVAQDVQEAVHELDPDWPACTEASCPAHLAHALFVEPDLGPDPFWTCHRTGLPVAPVGALGR